MICTIYIPAFRHSYNIVQSERCTTDELIIFTTADILIYSFFPFLFKAFTLSCTSISIVAIVDMNISPY